MRGQLSDGQLDVFYRKVVSYFESQAFEALARGQQERSLTNNQIGPALKHFVSTLLVPQMLVKHDGDVSVRPLLRHGMTFLPDAQVSIGTQKILSIEVKILRDSDPSGSLSKAVGQTYLYRALGFEMSLGLIFDGRTKNFAALEDTLAKLENRENRVKFVLFKSNLN